MTDKFGNPKGFAYVEFAHADSAVNAVLMNGSMLRDREIKVGLSTSSCPTRPEMVRNTQGAFQTFAALTAQSMGVALLRQLEHGGITAYVLGIASSAPVAVAACFWLRHAPVRAAGEHAPWADWSALHHADAAAALMVQHDLP